MIKLKFTLLLFFSLLANGLWAQENALVLQAVVQDVYNKAKKHSLYRKNVNWDMFHQKVFGSAIETRADLEKKVALIFETLEDRHATLLYHGKRVVYSKPASSFVLRPALKVTPDPTSNGFSTKLLEDSYAYIALRSPFKSDAQSLQSYQDQLCALNLKNLKGIIVDLRLNEGGSIFPIAAFGQLYDSECIGHNSTHDGLSGAWKVKDGKFYQNNSLISVVKNQCKGNDQLKIAVLISQITASSGEIMATTFKGRANTIFIGEKTYGLPTLNIEFNLGNGYYLGLSASFIADRKGKVYPHYLSPDLEIINGDDFADLNRDVKVKAAMEWFKK
jgi:carboxyl-terminal processing protease